LKFDHALGLIYKYCPQFAVLSADFSARAGGAGFSWNSDALQPTIAL